MWRPAVSRFGMLAIVASVSCWSGNTKTTDGTLENRGTQASERDLTAAYWCSITSGEFDYPKMPCVIRKVDGRFMLAKLAGSQRFRGVVTPRGEGFAFDGEFYCPWGDCTQPLHGVFAPAGGGTLRGTFDDKSLVVTLTPAPATGGFGGTTYGGDSYGGVGYGGTSFGGALRMPPPRH